MAEFLVGIDLGTTNSALSYARLGEPAAPTSFGIRQLVAEGEVAPRPTLPSALYLAAAQELPAGALELPWQASAQTAPDEVVGVLANTLGARQAGRLISSAKSWLCHGGVDREAAILPWGTDLSVGKLSPVDVSARYLSHLAASWDEQNPEHPLGDQDVVLAVPASFDEVARELTVAAAARAGLSRVRLLEEPQAALYAWTAAHPDWREHLVNVEQILVIDVGGGTTDFSLVAVRETPTGPGLERTFVGEHLLVGGDNMDLALAHAVAGDQRASLDASRWQQLTLQVRLAKERLLSAIPPGSVGDVEIAVAGAGRRLLGNTLRVSLSADTAAETLVEGFFPRVAADAAPVRGDAGLQEFGLPFAADPAITRHLAQFLEVAGRSAEKPICPDAILFNGGALKPGRIRARLCEQLADWTGKAPIELDDADHDLAVAQGAVAYGSALRGHGDRISGGSARAYFLGIEGPDGPSMICLAGRGMMEGEELALSEPVLELAANQHVQFPLYVSTTRVGDLPGMVYGRDPEHTVALAPLGSRLQFGKSLESRTVPVRLRSMLTETGTLEIWCEARDTPHRWKLSFDLRTQSSSEAWEQEGDAQRTGVEVVIEPQRLEAASELVQDAFAGSRDPVRIMGALEEALGLSRGDWPADVLRDLWEALWPEREARRRSAEHEARWLNLCGFLVRPGFGVVGDELRAEKVWRLFNGGLCFPKSSQCGAEWWVLWKRVAGGLSRPQQTALLQQMRPVLLPGNRRKKNRKKAVAQQLREMWQVIGSLERVGSRDKGDVFDALVGGADGLQGLSDAELWAVGRLGSRCPVYGPADTVLEPGRIAATVEAMAGSPEPLSAARALALAQMARMSGDRARDLPEKLRLACALRLEEGEGFGELAALVRSVQETSAQLRARIVADSLPDGLRIASSNNLP